MLAANPASTRAQGKRCILKDCCVILDDTVLAPGTVVPSYTVFGGSPGIGQAAAGDWRLTFTPTGRLLRKLPHSFQLSWSEHVKSFYEHFRPAPLASTSPKATAKAPA